MVLDIYLISKSFPNDELFGLTRQIRRSASSIPTNIAEGCGRSSDTELNRFLIIAQGSASELEYQLLLSEDLHYISQETYQKLSAELIEIRKMLNAFSQKIKARISKP